MYCSRAPCIVLLYLLRTVGCKSIKSMAVHKHKYLRIHNNVCWRLPRHSQMLPDMRNKIKRDILIIIIIIIMIYCFINMRLRKSRTEEEDRKEKVKYINI